ncbi:MAG: AraC family transcriptional regulator [Clostridiales bacterium]|nr:AraC family transcriptional regulator [Clostridiales bacterium]
MSDKLSFDNPQYFSRVFKRVTGTTPTEFKLSLNFEN